MPEPPASPATAPPFDAYAPAEIAARVEAAGVTKARMPLLTMVTLGVLAGGFIGLGALYYTVVTADAQIGFAAGRVLGGVVFSLGLVLVVVAGAELFTGNNLLVMAWVARKISTREFGRDLAVVFIANLAGAVGLALLVALSGQWQMAGDRVGQHAVAIAAGKTALPFWEALFRGVLCNVLVCLAVWLALAGRSVTDKVLAVVLPISAFVAAGFEHSVANMYFIPLGIMLRGQVQTDGIAGLDTLDWGGFLHNLLPVTIGNVLGGGVMVGIVFYIIYRRGQKPAVSLTAEPGRTAPASTDGVHRRGSVSVGSFARRDTYDDHQPRRSGPERPVTPQRRAGRSGTWQPGLTRRRKRHPHNC